MRRGLHRICGRICRGTDGPFSVRQFGGGKANLTYLVRFGDGSDSRE